MRQPELARLCRVLDAVGDRRGTVVEIAGEPGIGKTRLLTELAAAAADRGFTVARARSAELDQGMRFHPLAQALGEPALSEAVGRLPTDLARIVDDLRSGRPATDAADPVDPVVHTALRALLGHLAHDGLVLLFDDFHWADRDTTRFVEFLTRYPVPGGVLLVIAQRTRQSCSQLRGALAHGVETGTIDRIDLRALTIGQSADVLGVSLDDPRLPGLHRESTGIPRYLLALSGSEAAPITIPRPRKPAAAAELAAVFAGELSALSADEVAVTHAVAVLGTDACADVDAVAAVAGLPTARACAAASALLRRDVLRRADSGTGFGFRHPLLGQAVYAGLDPCWRAGAHRRAFAVLSGHGEPAQLLARHVERSLTLFQPADLTVLSDAARAVTTTDPDRAAHWLRTAIRMADTPRRTRLRIALAGTFVVTGDLDAARAVLEDAVTHTPRTDHSARAAAVADAALLDTFRGRFAEAASGITVELAAIPADQPAPKVRLLARQVITGLFGGDLPGTEWLAEFTDLVGRHGDPVATAGALAVWSLGAAYAGDVTAAAQAADDCVVLVDTMTDDDLADAPDCLTILGLAERILARFADAERHLRRQLAILRDTGSGFLRPIVLLALSMTQHCVARLDEARGAANEAKRIAEKLGAQHIRDVAAMLESAYLAMTDRTDGSRLAIRLAEQAVAVRLPRNWWFGTHAVLWLAATLEAAGEVQRCRSLVLDVGGGPELPRIPAGLRPRCFEMLAAAATGDSAAAADWAARASAAADSGALPYHHGYASLAHGHALRAQGSHMSAAARYRTAADVLGDTGMVGEQIRALSFAAGSARAAGLTGDATAYLVLARDLAARCGATVAPRAEQVPVPSIPDTRDADLSTLTNREREIAEIARTGRRTRDIADELALSPRTVDVHLTRIYRKLGIGSRAELAHLMSNLD